MHRIKAGMWTGRGTEWVVDRETDRRSSGSGRVTRRKEGEGVGKGQRKLCGKGDWERVET